MDSITLKAYAKINLGLDVLRKRQDGYHDVCMIMQTIDLYDTISIEKSKSLKPIEEGSHNQIQIKTNHPQLQASQSNLIYRTAALFLETFQIKTCINITLDKRIPIAAGLAGGSADAAATLIGLNQLFKTKLSQEELMKLGVKIGADVPYCIMKGTALSEGIGEILTPLPPMPDCCILLVKPDISVSTKFVYEHLKLDDSISHPNIKSMIPALEQKNLENLAKDMSNILETVTIREYPEIKDIKEAMVGFGALSSLMSGSGSTVFGIFPDSKQAEAAYEFFIQSKWGKETYLTKPYWP